MKKNRVLSNEKENSTCANALLCEVAVITPRFRDYLEFIRNQTIETNPNVENEKYCWVYSINSVRGKLFNRVEKLHNYFHLKDIDEVLDYLETHLRGNLT